MATGTIKQTANNSGTGYCKMPDGTLICWIISATGAGHSINTPWGSVYESDNYIQLGNWAVPFISAPAVTVQIAGTAGWTEKIQNVTTTSAGETKIVRATAGTGSFGLYVIGIGRWK